MNWAVVGDISYVVMALGLLFIVVGEILERRYQRRSRNKK